MWVYLLLGIVCEFATLGMFFIIGAMLPAGQNLNEQEKTAARSSRVIGLLGLATLVLSIVFFIAAARARV